jgi:uncharacterized protein YkwD
MGRVMAVTVVALVAVAGCGGGGSKKLAKPANRPSSQGGGVVKAEPTKGVLGPAVAIQNGTLRVIAKGGQPISPKEDRPTDAQQRGVAGSGACAKTSANPSPGNLRAMSAAILCLLNAERRGAGLQGLHSNRKLKKASQRMANLMVRQKFFAHDTPDGKSVLDRVKPTGYVRGRWTLGENLAWGSGALATPRAIVNGWMHSPGHRANILYGPFKDIGVGIKLGAPGPTLSGGTTYVTDFGKHS